MIKISSKNDATVKREHLLGTPCSARRGVKYIFSILFIKVIKNHKNNIFGLIVFPLEGNIDIDAGMGMEGGGTISDPQNPPTNLKESFVRKLFTLLGHFPKNLKRYL